LIYYDFEPCVFLQSRWEEAEEAIVKAFVYQPQVKKFNEFQREMYLSRLELSVITAGFVQARKYRDAVLAGPLGIKGVDQQRFDFFSGVIAMAEGRVAEARSLFSGRYRKSADRETSCLLRFRASAGTWRFSDGEYRRQKLPKALRVKIAQFMARVAVDKSVITAQRMGMDASVAISERRYADAREKLEIAAVLDPDVREFKHQLRRVTS